MKFLIDLIDLINLIKSQSTNPNLQSALLFSVISYIGHFLGQSRLKSGLELRSIIQVLYC